MQRESIVVGIAALIIGFLLGFLVASKSGVSGGAGQPVAQQGAGQPVVNIADTNNRIAEMEKIVAKDPKNLQAWVSLGNDYFDTNQAQKSIEAYNKALELSPNNPDILTDQGVMFRAVGFYDKALNNFEKANKINPQHMQSLYNMGIVYSVDLKQPDKAKPIFEKIIQQAPNTEMAVQARQIMQQSGGLKGK
jgi:tetratricopeptide (TPR) repeat protein